MVPTECPSLVDRTAAGFERYRRGEPSGIDDLVRAATPLLWRVARAQGLSGPVAEDVVQTAWLRLVDNADRLGDSHGVLAWLVVTTRREAWRVAKGERRAIAVAQVDELDVGGAYPDPARLAELSEQERLLWRHVGELPKRCQHLLAIVAYAEQPDYAAISDALGMPVGSIGPTRGRCLAKLRSSLALDPTWDR